MPNTFEKTVKAIEESLKGMTPEQLLGTANVKFLEKILAGSYHLELI